MVRVADDLLSRGEHAAAISALDRTIVWRTLDLQPLARLAAAHLEVEPTNAVARVRKLLALGTFCEKFAEPAGYGRPDLPLPRRTWGPSRMSEVATRARDWVERFSFGG